MREFEFVEDPLSDALTVADNTAGPGSTVMTVEERLSEKLNATDATRGPAEPTRSATTTFTPPPGGWHSASPLWGSATPAWRGSSTAPASAFLLRDQRANGRCTHGEVAASPPNNRPVFARRSSILRVRQTSGAPRSE